MRTFLSAVSAAVLLAVPAAAQEVWITPDMPFFEFESQGETYFIERDQNTEATIEGSFAKTSRPCPNFCIQPMQAAPGVETVGELEVLEFLQTHVEAGTGLLIDSRLESWHEAGTIPGSINLPFTLFDRERSPFFEPIMLQLGVEKVGPDRYDFTGARDLLLFCNGPWCGQSPRAIQNLISAGYPAERLRYYRGGMQSWLQLGFQTVKPAGS